MRGVDAYEAEVAAYKAELATFLAAFGRNVRRIRQKRRISQEALSHHARLHRTEIGKIEQGAVEPRLTTLFILAAGLEVPVEELLEDLRAPVRRKPSPQTQPWS
jgi:transcriptional regulator with XRE-family HTH domain